MDAQEIADEILALESKLAELQNEAGRIEYEIARLWELAEQEGIKGDVENDIEIPF